MSAHDEAERVGRTGTGRTGGTGIPALNARIVERLEHELGVSPPIAGRIEVQSDNRYPTISHARIPVNGERLAALLADLVQIAVREVPGSGLASLAIDSPSARELICAAIASNSELIARISALSGTNPYAVRTVTAMSAIVVLTQARGGRDEPAMEDWNEGWCRFCGGWPLLSELRGLERSRRLRCGRCGSDWELPWLLCAFCGESDHEKLCELLPKRGGSERKVDACRTCNGYLKSIPVLRALSMIDLLTVDAETVPLDLAALGAGFARPGQRPVEGVRLVESR